jgi:alkanesulfonate monooxygenase SsuD/methylene tetrahydromethanopterin reductase-like flavin-dependent oxidoreductase (luciferase family)
MSGICSAHLGHDATCLRCVASSPEEAKLATAFADGVIYGFDRGVQEERERVVAWLRTFNANAGGATAAAIEQGEHTKAPTT